MLAIHDGLRISWELCRATEKPRTLVAGDWGREVRLRLLLLSSVSPESGGGVNQAVRVTGLGGKSIKRTELNEFNGPARPSQ